MLLFESHRDGYFLLAFFYDLAEMTYLDMVLAYQRLHQQDSRSPPSQCFAVDPDPRSSLDETWAPAPVTEAPNS